MVIESENHITEEDLNYPGAEHAPKFTDYVGMEIGYLSIVKEAVPHIKRNGRKRTRYIYHCNRCGSNGIIYRDTLTANLNNPNMNCGCVRMVMVNIGDKFGKLTVISDPYRNHNNTVTYKCRCECGREVERSRSTLLELGPDKGCEFCREVNQRIEIFIGSKFGRLTVVDIQETISPTTNKKEFIYICDCDCGTKGLVKTRANLTNRTEAKSCGCLNKEKYQKLKEINTTHGCSSLPQYQVYISMRDRCYNPTCEHYDVYGGRGIKICEYWLEPIEGPKRFCKWAEETGYGPGLTIDRIDPNGDYSPENCRRVPILSQANNKRNNHFITFDNETYSVSRWAVALGIDRKTIEYRLSHGYSVEEALMTPPNGGGFINAIYFTDDYGNPIGAYPENKEE